MPLPPAPTKRAALLPPEAYDAPARSSHKASRKSEAAQSDSPLPERPQAMDFDPRSGGGELHPEALRDAPETYVDQSESPALKKRPPVPEPAAKPARRAKATGPAKLFVLDTNVLMHDPMS